jgi:hypothetical protein
LKAFSAFFNSSSVLGMGNLAKQSIRLNRQDAKSAKEIN